jgi:hypothetical protein
MLILGATTVKNGIMNLEIGIWVEKINRERKNEKIHT